MRFPSILLRRSGLFLAAVFPLVLTAPLAQAQKPSISQQPKSQNVAAGLTATIKVTASGAAPVYQWLHDGTDLSGATSTNLVLTNLQPADAGAYVVVITNSLGSVTSTPANLVVGRVARWGAGSSITNIPLAVTNVVQLAVGSRHAVALRADGTVVAWGDNSYGQTNVPAGLTNVSAIAVGIAHTMALCSNGVLVVWGANSNSQTNPPVAATNIVGIAAGGDESMVLRGDASVVTWGTSSAGTLQAPTDLRACAIKSGGTFCAAITRAGRVRVWGANTYGQATVPSGLSNVVAIAAGTSHMLALQGDGTVVAWGSNTNGQCTVPPSATNVVAISAGGSSSLALRSDGTVVGWGSNGSGQLDPPLGFSNITAVSLSISSSALGLRNFGSPTPAAAALNLSKWVGDAVSLSAGVVGSPPLAYQWQLNGVDILDATNAWLSLPKLQLTDAGVYQVIVSNAAGICTNLVATVPVRPQVSVAAWGGDGEGQCDIPAGLRNVVALAAAGNHSLVLKDDGTVFGWGESGGYQAQVPADLTNAVAIASGEQHNLALRSDSSIVSWGAPNFAAVTNYRFWGSGYTGMVAGTHFNLALTAGGTVSGWTDGWAPGPPAGLTGVVAIAAGDSHGLALRVDGTVVAWGYNHFGQTNVPPGLSNVVKIACGILHCVALTGDGRVVAWGDNRHGQTNVPPDLTNVVSIASEGWHSLAYRSDGTITGWGWNYHGQCNPPQNLTNVITLASGIDHNLALVGDSKACVTRSPDSFTIPTGATANFRVTATGTAPLSYQWLSHGTNLPGATNLSLTISNVQPTDAGAYAVVVTNWLGCATSQMAELTLGPILAWGLNSAQQTLVPPGLTNPVAVAGGVSHSLALRRDGTVVAWGDGWSAAPNLSNVVSIAANEFLSAVALSDGSVVVWGDNSYGVTNVPPGITNATAVAAGENYILVLTADGRVLSWGHPLSDRGQTNVPPSLTNAVAIAAGMDHAMALREDGTLVCWGAITNAPADATNVVAIAAGSYHNLALKADRTVVPWGSSSLNTPRPDLTNIVSIAAAYFANVAIGGDGGLVAWGENQYGQTNPPPGLHQVVAAGGGYQHILAVENAGEPWVTVPPFNRSVLAAGIVTFKCLATGNAPLSYQWQLNGTNLSGATDSVLNLTNVPMDLAGRYRCVVSNALGSIASADARLRVVPPPLVFDPPATYLGQTNVFKLHLSGLAGIGPITLFASSNLVDWMPVFTNGPALGTWEYLVTPGSNAVPTFYRASEAR